MNYLSTQFGNPHGVVGRLIGYVMARNYNDRNIWTIDLLDIQPDDHILEIGFGPGVAVQQAAEKASRGFVAGVDLSTEMLRQASQRNRAAIQAGRVELQQGSVSRLPFKDNQFDKAYTINTLHHWPHPVLDGHREIQRVLRPGGLFAVTMQPVWESEEAAIRAKGTEIAIRLADAGYENVHVKAKAMKPVMAVCVLATNPKVAL